MSYRVGWWQFHLQTWGPWYRRGLSSFRTKSWMWFHKAEVAQEQAEADARVQAFTDKFGSVNAAFQRGRK